MMLLLCVVAAPVVLWIVDGERRRREQGGRESKEEVKFSAGAENYLTSHPLFTFVYTPAPSLYLLVESLDEAPNQPSFANIFF